MSFGTQSPLFRPVAETMLATVHAECTSCNGKMIKRIYDIMTDRLHTEALLFATILVIIDRFRSGERETAAGFKRGAGIMLSAVLKNGTGKLQSPEMKLIHDVMVELQMAGRNFRHLQEYLKGQELAFVFMHSCGGAIIPYAMIEDFEEEVAVNQERRTLLDWQGTMRMDDSPENIVATCEYSEREAAVVRRIITLAECMIAAADETPTPLHEHDAVLA